MMILFIWLVWIILLSRKHIQNPNEISFLSDDQEREEYVLSDATLIWRGSYNRMKPSIWQLGQFERNVLECALLLLSTVGKIAPAFRGDPVRVCRSLSALVNSPDDDGAIMGNWSEDFSGGTPPVKWLGSVEILQQYFKKRRPVKYGQCWTFAGTLTTSNYEEKYIKCKNFILNIFSCSSHRNSITNHNNLFLCA